ncbi:MAG: hypothetical protein ACREOM_08200 [Candidatus Dormibacteraceae bacterium]
MEDEIHGDATVMTLELAVRPARVPAALVVAAAFAIGTLWPGHPARLAAAYLV